MCKTKDCVASRNHYKLTGHSCTSNLFPGRIPDNRECLLCSHCMTACPSSNFRLSLRMPGDDFLGRMRVRLADMVLLLIVIGFVNNNPPSLVFIVVPLLLTLAICWKRPWDALQAFAVLLIPITAVAHALHSWRGLIYNSPYWDFHLSDQLGIRTATLLTDGVLKLNPGALSSAGNWYAQMVDFLHGAVFALCVMIISRSRISKLPTASSFGETIARPTTSPIVPPRSFETATCSVHRAGRVLRWSNSFRKTTGPRPNSCTPTTPCGANTAGSSCTTATFMAAPQAS